LTRTQIVARKATNVTPEQLEEFESAFHAFDKDGKNSLDIDELGGALGSLGLPEVVCSVFFLSPRRSQLTSPSRLQNLDDIAPAGEEVTFEEFIRFLVRPFRLLPPVSILNFRSNRLRPLDKKTASPARKFALASDPPLVRRCVLFSLLFREDRCLFPHLAGLRHRTRPLPSRPPLLRPPFPQETHALDRRFEGRPSRA
jgi:hypothetical protein